MKRPSERVDISTFMPFHSFLQRDFKPVSGHSYTVEVTMVQTNWNSIKTSLITFPF